MTILSKADLQEIEKHKYAGEDFSLLSKYVLVHWWEFVTKLMPRTLAPNSITALGCLFLFAAHATLMWFCPQLHGVAPNWVYFFAAAGVFLFQTLDAVDGKQARRLRFLFPLGDLFDHCSDIISFSTGMLTLTTMMQVPAFTALLTSFVAGTVSSYCYHWEMRYTSKLTLGLFNGPVEGTLIGMVQFIMGGIKGPMSWTRTLREETGLEWMPDMGLNTFTVISLMALTALTVTPNATSVYAATKGKRNFLAVMFRDLTLLFLPCGLVILWCWLNFEQFEAVPLPACYAVILLGSDAQNRQIVCRLSKKQPPMFAPLLIPTLALVANTGLRFVIGHSFIPEAHAIMGLVVICFAGYVSYATLIVREICDHLGIKCFSTDVSGVKIAALKQK
eukprot:TRINITY_DN937_c0_g1_i2.p1 TRINITY_DN937_c0_g1~~TRINITY_DN937_c0_g1_i2.p1  ORF type:complete len:390 (-),score=91.07 TRINITY_DN937_c0_g1_i2:1004-2173(-)